MHPWNRTESLVGIPSIEEWPSVDIGCLSPKDREIFSARMEAVRLYVQGYPMSTITARTNVSPSMVVPMTKRCVAMAPDGRVMGFRALIPYLRFKVYERKAAVKAKRQEQKGGHAGALGALLTRFPEIEAQLVALIKKDAKHHEIHEHRIRPRDLHRIFLALLKNNGVSHSEWPFNTKFRGIRSIQKYMRSILNTFFDRAVNSRGEKIAKAHLAVGRGVEPLLLFEEPFDAVELDAYSINALFSVAFHTPEGTETDVLLERIWLIAMIDRASSAVISYNVIYSSEVCAEDVLRVIRGAMRSWNPMELTIPGLSYPAGGGLPGGVISECVGAMWGCILLDGALAHLAKAVYEAARTNLGFIVNWGPAGHFERRPNVERLFKSISDEIFMRFPSTTGCNPGSGRAQNAEKIATQYRIRAIEAEELIDVQISQFNATPSEGLSYRTPLEYIDHFVSAEQKHFIVRHLPKRAQTPGNPIPVRKECVVRGGQKNGRRPYIELDRCRYTSSILGQLPSLVGQKIVIEIDEDDLRQVKAFLPNGAELGFVKVAGRWALTKHSRKTRQAINRLVNRRVLVISEFDDPVQVYMHYLSAKNKTSRKKDGPTPNKATEATRLARETGLSLIIEAERPVNVCEDGRSTKEHTNLMDKPLPDLNKLINRQR